MDSREVENERIRQLTEQNRQQAVRIQQLEQELERLKQLLAGKADSKAAKTPVFKENYSLGRNDSTQTEAARHGSPPGGGPKDSSGRWSGPSTTSIMPTPTPERCVFRREQFRLAAHRRPRGLRRLSHP